MAVPLRDGAPGTPLDRLFQRREELRQNAASLARQTAAETNPGRREQLRKQLRRVEESGEHVSRYVRYMLALGHAWRIKTALRQARLATLAGAGLVIGGGAAVLQRDGRQRPTYVPVVTTTPPPAASPAASVPLRYAHDARPGER